MRSHLSCLACLSLSTLIGCATTSAEEEESTADAVTQVDAPRRAHLFVIRTKGFIARITDVGDVGSVAGNIALQAFSIATNASFSEDPKDGHGPTDTGYRLWAELQLDVRCVGGTVTMTVDKSGTDAGYEGPLKAERDPLRVATTKGGKFYYQARGRPHPAAKPAFDAVASRTNTTIWYEVSGTVTCDENADATLHLDPPVTTPFPSFRLWVTQHSGGREGAEALIVDQPQGALSELWSLPDPPTPPTF
jgi:hypothetical protein